MQYTALHTTAQYSIYTCSNGKCSAVQYITVQYSIYTCSNGKCSAVQYITVQYSAMTVQGLQGL